MPAHAHALTRACIESRALASPHSGLTPVLPPAELEEIGFKLAAYPLDLLNASILGMQQALGELAQDGRPAPTNTLPFAELQAVVGFPEYYDEEERYRVPPAAAKE